MCIVRSVCHQQEHDWNSWGVLSSYEGGVLSVECCNIFHFFRMDRQGRLSRVWWASCRTRGLGTARWVKTCYTSKGSSAVGSRDLGDVWVCFGDKQEKHTLSRYNFWLTLDYTENWVHLKQNKSLSFLAWVLCCAQWPCSYKAVINCFAKVVDSDKRSS